jgi:hypothetical protein
LIAAITALAAAVRAVGEGLGEPGEWRESRRQVVNAYALARSAQLPESPTIVVVLVAQIRSMSYDLLRSTGLNRVDALALLDG